MGLRAQLFGAAVFSRDGDPVGPFRSRSAKLLLAALVLSNGEAASRRGLERDLWPESELDQRAQNLRRALADVRSALGDPEFVTLDEGSLKLHRLESTDAGEFDRCIRSMPEDPTAAARAIQLYTAPLLAGFEDDWVERERERREIDYALAVSNHAGRLVENGAAEKALPVVREALRLAPNREPVYVAAIQTFAALNLNSEALTTFEKLEEMLQEQWGESPSEIALRAVESLPRPPRAPKAPVRASEGAQGGALPPNAVTYVVRETDRQVREALANGDGLVQLRGARQIGKSSLLSRLLATPGLPRMILIDFQAFDRAVLEDLGQLYRALLFQMHRQLKFESQCPWYDWMGANTNFEEGVASLLAQLDQPLCLVFDEVDRLFDREYAPDVFGLFRAWFNRRAYEPGSGWGTLSMVLAHAIEPHLFLKDLNQSPFNVGTRVALAPFSVEEIARFATLLGQDPSLAPSLLEITAGLPLPTRKLFLALQDGLPVSQLAAESVSANGPLAEILRRHQLLLSQHPDLAAEFAQIRNGRIASYEAALRLESIGLAVMKGEGAVIAGSWLSEL